MYELLRLENSNELPIMHTLNALNAQNTNANSLLSLQMKLAREMKERKALEKRVSKLERILYRNATHHKTVRPRTKKNAIEYES